jgi:hypothetical protein
MIIGLQIIALIFAFSMLYFAMIHYKRREISRTEVITWFVMWGVAIVVIVFPELLRSFSRTFLVTRVFDFMVIAGFVLVISLTASSYVRTRKLEKKLEDIVRREALKAKKKV